MPNIQFRFPSITALKTDLTEKANIRSGIRLQGPQVASAQALDILTRLQKIGTFLLAALATLFTGFDRNWKKATREVALQVYTGEVYTLSHLPQFPIAANRTPDSPSVSPSTRAEAFDLSDPALRFTPVMSRNSLALAKKIFNLQQTLSLKCVSELDSASHPEVVSLRIDKRLADIDERIKNCPNVALIELDSTLSVEDVGFLKNCSQLTSLNLRGCKNIVDFSFLENCAELTSLNLSECRHINDFSFLQRCSALTSLDLSCCTQINDFSFLQGCSALKSLNLFGCEQIRDLSFLEHCPQLTSLNLSWCREIKDFSALKLCPALTSLKFFGNRAALDLSFLDSCRALTSLEFLGCEQLENYSLIGCCSKLTSLKVSKCQGIQDFSFLENCPALTSLDLSYCEEISDISFLKLCPQLTSLALAGCNQIKDFSFLKHCPQLTSVNLDSCDLHRESLPVQGLSFLQDCSELTSLNLSGYKPASSASEPFSVFCYLQKLTLLVFDNCSLKNSGDISRNYPHIYIEYSRYNWTKLVEVLRKHVENEKLASFSSPTHAIK